MIRPAALEYAETADVRERMQAEFDAAAETLRAQGVDIFVFEDTVYPPKPNAIFPSDWVSFHEDGTVVLYPMLYASRRAERRSDIIEGLRSVFDVGEIVDLSGNESRGRFLEGAGSMVLDRANAVAYACPSARTDESIFRDVCERLGYRAVVFRAQASDGRPIEHTSAMMSIATDFAVVCLDSIGERDERIGLAALLRETGHQLIDITFQQMEELTGTILELRANGGVRVVAGSRRAIGALSGQQRNIIERHCQLLSLDMPTIERSGGSVRNMIAEIFLPRH